MINEQIENNIRKQIKKYYSKHKKDIEFSQLDLQNYEIGDDIKDTFRKILSEIQEMRKDSTDITVTIHKDIKDIEKPKASKSAWQLYEKYLSNKIPKEEVESIKNSVSNISKYLSLHRFTKATKGLVMGDIQSGKTNNMCGVISLNADHGYNFFVLLTGTINKLKEQTKERIKECIVDKKGNLEFVLLNDLCDNSPKGERLQDLSLSSNKRYIYVCLKNKNILRNLIKWFAREKSKAQNLKAIVIDDEADLASINTKEIVDDEDQQERTAINKLIIDIVEGNTKDGKIEFKNLDYVAYTATPYGNFLNEMGESSLFPSDYVVLLNESPLYHGVSKIFGNEEAGDIVNIISKEEEKTIETFIKINETVPKELQNSILWFICGVACMRFWNIKGNTSMLINVSNKKKDHRFIHDNIMNWARQIDKQEIVKQCKQVWETQTKKFTKESLIKRFKNAYDDSIEDYPIFEDIKKGIINIIEKGFNNILKKQDELVYSKGINVCIDNSDAQNKDENIHYRLEYPYNEDSLHAFLVIGGNTLSRGITLEKLITTYFLTNSTQADSLLQKGRWFGYRPKIELIPRIWMSKKNKQTFRKISEMNIKNKENIKNRTMICTTPKEYPPRICELEGVRLTAKNKQQSAHIVEQEDNQMQTLGFIKNKGKDNIELLSNFIAKIKPPLEIKENIIHFEDMDKDEINDFINKLHLVPKEKRKANSLLKNKQKWNVFISTKKEGSNISLGRVQIRAVERSVDKEEEKQVFIKTLRRPDDFLKTKPTLVFYIVDFKSSGIDKNVGFAIKTGEKSKGKTKVIARR